METFKNPTPGQNLSTRYARSKKIFWAVYKFFDTLIEFISRSIGAFIEYWLIFGIMLFVLFAFYLHLLP